MPGNLMLLHNIPANQSAKPYTFHNFVRANLDTAKDWNTTVREVYPIVPEDVTEYGGRKRDYAGRISSFKYKGRSL